MIVSVASPCGMSNRLHDYGYGNMWAHVASVQVILACPVIISFAPLLLLVCLSP